MFRVLYMFRCLGLACSAIVSPNIADYRAYIREGDINIGFMTNIHSDVSCNGSVSISGTLNSEQIAFAVNKINNCTEILPNITLGFVVLDSCSSALRALGRSVYFLKDSSSRITATGSWFDYPGEMILPGSPIEQELYGSPTQYDVAGLIGLATSRETINVAALMNAFRIPVISHLATSDELSDRVRFPYFLRVVPPDRFSAEALIDIMLHFNWSYVSLLYSEGSYGENGAKQIEQLLESLEVDICISFSYRISSTAEREEYEWVAGRLIQYKSAKVVLMFCDSPQQRELLDTLDRLNLKHMFLFLGSDTFVGRQEVNEGAIYVGHKSNTVDGYRDFLKNNTPWNNPANPWLLQIWQTYFDCTWMNETVNSTKSCYLHETPEVWTDWYGEGNSRIYDAVFSLAYGFHNHITHNCPSQLESVDKANLRDCLREVSLVASLLNVSFEGVTDTIAFDAEGNMLGQYELKHYKKLQDGRFTSIKVGEWSKLNNTLSVSMSKIDWSMFKPKNMTPEPFFTDNFIPESICSKPCAAGHAYIYQEGKCCWQCHKCRDNEILTSDNLSICLACPPFTWPDQESFTDCLPVSPQYMRPTSYSAVLIMIFGLGGFILTLLVSVIFWTHRKHRLIRATSRELTFCTLLGSLFSSASALAFVLKPTKAACLVRMLGFHYSVNVLYSSMLVKTVRIFRIFKAGKRAVRRPRFVSSVSQIILVITLIVIEVRSLFFLNKRSLCEHNRLSLYCFLFQTVIVAVVEITDPIEAILSMPTNAGAIVELRCYQSPTSFIIPTSFNLSLILICLILGFMTRKLPENFNESRYIFVLVATTLFSWLVFLPAYYIAYYGMHELILLSLCLLMHVFSNLLLSFAPKIYAIYYVKDARVVLKNSFTESVCGTVIPDQTASNVPGTVSGIPAVKIQHVATTSTSVP